MNSIKVFFIFLLLLFLNLPRVAIASDLIDFGALNKNIILLHFDDGYVRYHQKGEARSNEWVVSEPLNITEAENTANYQISGNSGFYSSPQHPVKIERKSKGTEFTWLCQNWVNGQGCVNGADDHAKEHWIYLFLPESLEEGKTYKISTADVAGNGGTREFEFSLEKNRSEAIHVNLVGYDPEAPEKYGYVYLWSGSGGSVDFSEYQGNEFYLLDNQTKEKVFTGNLEFRKK